MSRPKLASTWVLETQTKGTGATMVPLERVLKKPGPAVPRFPLPALREVEPEQRSSRQPLVFKVVDVMSREVISEGVDARAAVAALEGVRSIVDVTVYVWEPDAERWRLLTLAETRALWKHRTNGTNNRPAASQA
jgi:hypothetical protein